MICRKCGKEIRDDALFCDFCGYDQRKDIQILKINDLKSKFLINKRKNILISTLCIVFCLFLFWNHFSLSSIEKKIYEGCIELKSCLKNPDSFCLPDNEATVITNKKSGTIYIILQYGGTNSYGGVVTSEAVFENGEYIMDYGDYDKTNSKHIEVMSALKTYEFSISTNGIEDNKNWQTDFVNLDKIKKKLNIN
ncbi:zinc ribbon domain-containing protein [Thomasclavelia sp.]|uniref:zinc ribbon domain-containing protein n=1 Tax=Thomasclavelia sp. TaxID=3025757 RepID=UPI0025FD25DF|nr:zinc ribbon domain-containing protein [Thomasclavelia sp.]